jgi:hypothetical protein
MEPPPAPSINSGWRSVIASRNRAREYGDVLAATNRYDHECSAIDRPNCERSSRRRERRRHPVVGRSAGPHRRPDGRLDGRGDGVRAAAQLAEITGGNLDRAGRIAVEPDLTLPDHPEVLALGDKVRVRGTRLISQEPTLHVVRPPAQQVEPTSASTAIAARAQDRDRGRSDLARLRYAAFGTIIGRTDDAGDSKGVASVAMRPAPPTMT